MQSQAAQIDLAHFYNAAVVMPYYNVTGLLDKLLNSPLPHLCRCVLWHPRYVTNQLLLVMYVIVQTGEDISVHLEPSENPLLDCQQLCHAVFLAHTVLLSQGVIEQTAPLIGHLFIMKLATEEPGGLQE